MYMSYCRYEGTRMELSACLSDVEAHVNREAEYEVSPNEIEWFRRMVTEFTDWLHDMALLDEDGYLDEEALDDICVDMASKADEDEEFAELEPEEVFD